MIRDLVFILKDVRDNPVCDFINSAWYFTGKGGELSRACPLTQAAVKLGMKITPEGMDKTSGSKICEYLEAALDVESRVITGVFVSYDRGEPLTNILIWLEKGAP